MINKLEDYVYAGVKAAEARNDGDETRARFHLDWTRRAINLESGDYRKECQKEFDAAYKRARSKCVMKLV